MKQSAEEVIPHWDDGVVLLSKAVRQQKHGTSSQDSGGQLSWNATQAQADEAT